MCDNVCCDNFFTSLPLAKRLSELKTSIVGTIRRNRRELTKEMTSFCYSIHESKFFWHEEVKACFVNYQCKKQKNVCLLSTMHSAPTTAHTEKKKPIMIEYYNKNKTGVDCFDQMSRLQTTKSCSRRWPLAVWANILDISAINAWIIYRKVTGKRISRRTFILNLVHQLREKSKIPQQPVFPICYATWNLLQKDVSANRSIAAIVLPLIVRSV